MFIVLAYKAFSCLAALGNIGQNSFVPLLLVISLIVLKENGEKLTIFSLVYNVSMLSLKVAFF